MATNGAPAARRPSVHHSKQNSYVEDKYTIFGSGGNTAQLNKSEVFGYDTESRDSHNEVPCVRLTNRCGYAIALVCLASCVYIAGIVCIHGIILGHQGVWQTEWVSIALLLSTCGTACMICVTFPRLPPIPDISRPRRRPGLAAEQRDEFEYELEVLEGAANNGELEPKSPKPRLSQDFDTLDDAESPSLCNQDGLAILKEGAIEWIRSGPSWALTLTVLLYSCVILYVGFYRNVIVALFLFCCPMQCVGVCALSLPRARTGASAPRVRINPFTGQEEVQWEVGIMTLDDNRFSAMLFWTFIVILTLGLFIVARMVYNPSHDYAVMSSKQTIILFTILSWMASCLIFICCAVVVGYANGEPTAYKQQEALNRLQRAPGEKSENHRPPFHYLTAWVPCAGSAGTCFGSFVWVSLYLFVEDNVVGSGIVAGLLILCVGCTLGSLGIATIHGTGICRKAEEDNKPNTESLGTMYNNQELVL